MSNIVTTLTAPGEASGFVRLEDGQAGMWEVSGNFSGTLLLEKAISLNGAYAQVQTINGPGLGSVLGPGYFRIRMSAGSGAPSVTLKANVGDVVATVNGRRGNVVAAPPAVPLVDVKVTAYTASASTPKPVDVFDGYLWGVFGGNIYRSSDDGASWTLYAAGPGAGTAVRLMKTNDGEVVAVWAGSAYKSSGWASGSPTWNLKFTKTGAGSILLAFGADGNGEKFIIGEYAGDGQWQDSVKVWISTDRGTTFTVKYNAQTRYPTDYDDTHIHGCCYDPWADMFLVSEGHSPAFGIYYSLDDGDTWTRITKGIQPSPMPTVLIATENGIVCGSDAAMNGVYIIPRTEDPADMEMRWAWEWKCGAPQLNGFADRGFRDPDTGIVYIGYRSEAQNSVGVPIGLTIAASDGINAWRAWEGPAPVAGPGRVYDVLVSPTSRKLIAHIIHEDNSTSLLRARIPGGSATPAFELDPGGVLGGKRSDTRQSVAVGQNALAGWKAVAVGCGTVADGEDRIAVGFGAKALASAAMAVGWNANAGHASSTVMGRSAVSAGDGAVVYGREASASTSGIAVGYLATAGGSCTVVGREASTTSGHIDSVVVGRAATSGGTGVAVGRSATGGTSNAVAVGYQATTGSQCVAVGSQSNSSNSSTAVGRSAVASGTTSAAFGHSASATHASSVALGASVATTAASQVAIGPRHIHLGILAADPAAPAADTAATFLRKNGSNKLEFCVLFPTGAVQVLATEP